MRNLFARIAALTILVFALYSLHAQNSTTSALTGVVSDPSGAVIQGATVTLSNPSKGTSFTTKTDSNGSYRFNGILPAQGYVVTITRDGFASSTVSDVTLNVSIARTQNVTMNLGSASDTLQVSAGNEQVTLNTTDASIGNNINVEMIQDLPVQARTSPQVLFNLQPGVNAGSVAGARVDQSETTLDGMDVNDLAAGQSTNSSLTSTFQIIAGAPVDAIQEFRGTVAGLPSQIGTGSGGQFQMVVKSGTNKFHGNLNEYHRDTSTAANTWFNNNSTVKIPRTALIRNQFGGNIGGPIFRDKLFFFFDVNLSRISQSQTATRTVPLDSFRNGNLNYITNATGCTSSARLNNPATASCIATLNSGAVASKDPKGLGFNSNLLSFINSRYPHANDLSLGDGVNTGGYRFTQRTPDNLTQYVAKVNYNLTPKQQIFLQYHTSQETATQTLNQFDVDPFTHPFEDHSYGYVVSHIWQIGGNKVNQFYFGNNITKFKFPTSYFPTGNISFTFGGLSAPNASLGSQFRRVPVPEFRDDFNWVAGHHNIQIGGLFKFIKTNSNLTNDYTFATVGLGGTTSTLNTTLRPDNILATTTARGIYDSLFTFALGRVAQESANYNFNNAGQVLAPGSGATRSYRYFQTEMYLGDTWKVTPELTLSYGVRYQLYTVPYETHGNQTNPDIPFQDYMAARVAQASSANTAANGVPFITYTLGGKANNAGPAYNPSYKDLGPRFSFAYQPKDTKTVINGGFGLVYDRTVVNALNFVQDQNSYLFQSNASRTYGNANANTALLNDPRVGASLAIPAAPTSTVPGSPYTPYVTNGKPNGTINNQFNYEIDKNFKTPYSLMFNAGLQQELPGRMVLKLNYAGRFGKKLIGQADGSQLIDFPDKASNQTMSQAFANTTRQLRANPALLKAGGYTGVTSQPWFEHVLPATVGTANGYANNTQFLVDNFGDLLNTGDMADLIQALQSYGFIGYNVGLASQFAGNTFITNQGWSKYHGMLVTLSKNRSHGLQFDVNYTWSHSIDNVSAVANYIGSSTGLGQICDALDVNKCRGNSDFDITHNINGNFIYDLPFGRGRAFGSKTPRVVDYVIGGWSVSGIPGWRSGLPYTTTTGAYVAGYANNSPAIFKGNYAAIRNHLHKTAAGQVVLFDDLTAAANAFEGPIGLQTGNRNFLRGPGATSLDLGLAKTFPIVGDRVRFKFRTDAFNVLNHPIFNNPSTNSVYSGSFGQITTTANSLTGTGARVLQFAGRIEF